MNLPRLPRWAFGLVLALAATPAGFAHPSHSSPFVLAQAAPPAPPEPPATMVPLKIEVSLAGEPGATPALVRITSVATGKTINLPVHLRRQMGWYSLPAGATVEVPAGELRIEACRGLDTEVATADVRAGAGSAPTHARLALHRFYDSRARGFVGANTHLHLRYGSSGGTSIKTKAQAEEYLSTVGRSDALDLAEV